jgi:hypothetical protein
MSDVKTFISGRNSKILGNIYHGVSYKKHDHIKQLIVIVYQRYCQKIYLKSPDDYSRFLDDCLDGDIWQHVEQIEEYLGTETCLELMRDIKNIVKDCYESEE